METHTNRTNPNTQKLQKKKSFGSFFIPIFETKFQFLYTFTLIANRFIVKRCGYTRNQFVNQLHETVVLESNLLEVSKV